MSATLATTQDLANAPDDGYERWIVRGQLRKAAERFHTRDQGAITSYLCWRLLNWCDDHPELGFTGYVGPHCRLARDPDTTVFANFAVTREESWVAVGGKYPDLIEGAPTLLVDIADDRDDPALLRERERCYRELTTNPAWVIRPQAQTVAVYENGLSTEFSFDSGGMLGGRTLPGLALDVRSIFEHD